jgi:hypothetical protein
MFRLTRADLDRAEAILRRHIALTPTAQGYAWLALLAQRARRVSGKPVLDGIGIKALLMPQVLAERVLFPAPVF